MKKIKLIKMLIPIVGVIGLTCIVLPTTISCSNNNNNNNNNNGGTEEEKPTPPNWHNQFQVGDKVRVFTIDGKIYEGTIKSKNEQAINIYWQVSNSKFEALIDWNDIASISKL